MALKTFNPTSPGRRQLVLVDRSGLHKGAPVKALTEGKHSSGGRNNLGRRTSRWRASLNSIPSCFRASCSFGIGAFRIFSGNTRSGVS